MYFFENAITLTLHVAFIIFWHAIKPAILDHSKPHKRGAMELWPDLIAHTIFTVGLDLVEAFLHL